MNIILHRITFMYCNMDYSMEIAVHISMLYSYLMLDNRNHLG